MRFKTKDIGEEGVEVRVPVTGAWLEAASPDIEARPAPHGLEVRGRLHRTSDGYLLRADVRGALTVPCARCLEQAALPVDAPVVVQYVERDPKGSDEDDESDVVSFEGDVIDIGPEVRDEILLALPIGPLCREDCAGICPVCGGNRNSKPCDCEERQRMAASKLGGLAKLKI